MKLEGSSLGTHRIAAWLRRALGLTGLLVALPAVLARQLGPEISRADIAAATVAKILCTGLFVSRLREEQLWTFDLATVPRVPSLVDREHQSVLSTIGSIRRSARFNVGRGCTLDVSGATGAADRPSPKAYGQILENDRLHPAPWTVAMLPALTPALDRAFEEGDPQRIKHTRAVIVVQHGQVVAERYAQGIDADMPLPGYSMAKGMANLLVGAMVREGWVRYDQLVLHREWNSDREDRRRQITIEHLLRMTSGLQWTEEYIGTASDAMVMLTSTHSPGRFAAGKPLRLSQSGGAVSPGSEWLYSSGDYAILAEYLGGILQDQGLDPSTFVYERWFRRLGMTSAVIEITPDGYPFISSFMLATARDWARLGQFLLRIARREPHELSDLLPEGWIAESLRPTGVPGMRPGSRMGAAFWVDSLGQGAPPDGFFLAGYQGQFVIVLPSLDAVIVRLGSANFGGPSIGRELASDVAAALKATKRVSASE